jgi:hypothetical protein
VTMERVLRKLLPRLLDEQREDLIALFTEAILEEREACAAMVMEKFYTMAYDLQDVEEIVAAIRARP